MSPFPTLKKRFPQNVDYFAGHEFPAQAKYFSNLINP